MTKKREQIPTPPNEWIYKQESEEERLFWTKFTHWNENEPDLPECTNEEKEEWERQHQPVEYEQ